MTHDNIINETVTVLTQRISQILDDAKHLTNINMGSAAGRQFVAAEVAARLVTGREGKCRGCASCANPCNR